MPASKKVTKTKPVSKPIKIATGLKALRNDNKLSVPVYSLLGKETGTLDLPKEIFGAKVNKILLSQAMRVYMANSKVHTASTKTRGQVHGTTAKMYRQKGTGRARHGAQTAPIFVGGGVAFGPKPKKVSLDLPKKMKKAALISALSDKALEKGLLGVSGLEKASGKTKEIAALMKKVAPKRSVLLVTEERKDNLIRGFRNIKGINVLSVNMLNAYEVVRHQILMINKEAVEKLVGGKK